MNGNKLTLTIGGVRAYNHTNLYSKKGAERFKVFIGFTCKVCTNLCVSTDGFLSCLEVTTKKSIFFYFGYIIRKDYFLQSPTIVK